MDHHHAAAHCKASLIMMQMEWENSEMGRALGISFAGYSSIDPGMAKWKPGNAKLIAKLNRNMAIRI